ncbi:MAG TPA: hypothetical protein VGU63_02870 [Candidatus Acidoferrales bacterium]|nr:hypothetical protein [Candidatus Acidoferrales bacterium]
MLSAPSMFNAPAASNAAAPPSNYIQPTLNHGLRIWWAYYWPTTLVVAVLSFCVSYWLRVLYQNLVVSAAVFIWVARLQNYALTYLVAIFGIQYVLRRRFRRFRIALVSTSVAETTDRLAVTARRGLRVWWTFVWRTLVYAAIAYVVVILPLGWFVGIFAPGLILMTIFFLVVGIVINGAISLFIIYSNILDEDFGDFRVVLLPREPAAQDAVAAAPPAASPATP